MWQVMITLHTVAGVAAFAVGMAVLQPRRARRHRWLLPTLLWLLVVLVVTMVGAMAAHWSDLPAATQIAFSALVGLGGYMVFRARRARAAGPPALDDAGFLLISLFDGFVIVTALDLGAPPWAVAVLAGAAVVGGHRAVQQTKRRWAATESSAVDE